MANILTELKNWSTTEASNQPDSTDATTLVGDLRAIQAGVRYIYSQDTIASATTCDLGSKTAGSLTISGTTTITGLGTVSAGIRKSCVFSGILTLTHNGTSLILPGAANITTAANDRAEFESLGSGNWRCNWYVKASGQPVTSPLSDGDKGDITVSSSGATWSIDDDVIDAATLGDSALGVAMINGTLTASVAASALTIAIKTKAGNDPSASEPVLCVFRNATLATGDYVVRSVTAATSLVISSGSTLGTTSGAQSQINVLVIDNSGTVELAAVNNAGYLDLPETDVITTTAEGGAGAADSINTVYSTTGRTSVPYRNVGYVVSTQATAGTWASSPTQIQLTYAAKSRGLASGSVVSLSGAATELLTNIPSWVKKITIGLASVSTNGNSDIIIQIGDSGGYKTSGYLGSAWVNATNTLFTAGFGIAGATGAGSVSHGNVTLVRVDSANFTWSYSFTGGRSDTASNIGGGGSASLTGAITQVRITTVGGANTFDGGSGIVIIE